MSAEFNAPYSLQSCAKNKPLNLNNDKDMTILAILPKKKLDLGFVRPAYLTCVVLAVHSSLQLFYQL